MTNDDILRALATLNPNNQGVGSIDVDEEFNGPISPVTPGDVREGNAAANPWVTTNYGVENPNNFVPYTQFNKGIGDTWFEDMDKWKDIRSGATGYDPDALGKLEEWSTGHGETGELMRNQDWIDASGYGADGFLYKGADGKDYVIHRGTNGDDAQDGQDGYTVTPLHQDNKIVAYNGIPHDQFDAEGKYVGSALPQNMGHDKPWRDAALMAAMVATAGIGGAYFAPELAAGAGGAAGVGGAGTTFGVVDTSLIGVGLEGVGTAGAGAGAVGGGLGTGSGAFVGEGAVSGIGAWDAALANAVPAGAAGAGGAAGNWAPVTEMSTNVTGPLSQSGGGWEAFVNGMTGTGSGTGFFEGLMNDPQKLLKVASLIGGLSDIGKDPAEGMINPMTGGWNGDIPNYTSTRRQLPYDSNRRAGGAPQRHFTDIQYRAEGGPVSGGSGIEGLLKGPGTGQSDHIEATIEGQQPARLAREEFVVPADVVSALGDGSTEAGADALYQMMDRIRGAAHGKTTQQNRVDPGQVLPA